MKNRRCAFAAAAATVVCAVVFLHQDKSSDEAVKSVSGERPAALAPVAPPGGSAVALASVQPTSNQTATVRGTKPYVLASETVFDKPLRLAAEAVGVRTVGVLSGKRLLVEADAAAVRRLNADRRFSGVSEFCPSAKIAPDLAAQIANGAKTVDVSFLTLSPDDRRVVINRIVSRGGEVLTGCLNDGDTFSARMSAELVSEFASYGDVRWMERFVRPHLMNDKAVEPETMNVRSIWKIDEEDLRGLSGAGQVISTSDSGIDTGDLETIHEDLRNRVKGIRVYTGCNTSDVNGHGTHTAGSIVGDGTLSEGRIRGTAWGADLYAWFCGGAGASIYTPENYNELFQNNGSWPAYIHSASWGSSSAGKYTSRCAAMDGYTWSHPEFLPVYSAGNDGRNGETTIGDPAAAKNVLAVGATQNLRTGHDGGWGNGDPTKTAVFSSRGPCLDGRIKPDIAAPGAGILSTRSYQASYSYGVDSNTNYAYDSGTSMSCPLTAGAVALVREWLMRRTEEFADEDGKRPTAALMKAVITGGARGAETPGNEQGWGRVDLAETLFPSNRAVKLVDRIPFAAGEELIWIVDTTNAAPLDVQLVWIDWPGEPAGDQSAAKLVNDLDLTVEAVSGDGTVLYGNGGDVPDTLNNLESVRIGAAPADKYIITVNCKTILHDHTEGGAAALYIRGAFDPDVTPEDPAYVRIRETGVTYIALDKALDAVEDGQTVEILQPAKLRKSWAPTNAVNFAIVATNDDPTASAVTCAPGATLSIGPGSTLSLSNVVFASAGTDFIRVSAGGCVRVAGRIGGLESAGGVRVEDADGFVLAGALDGCIYLNSPSNAVGRLFAFADCDYLTASNCAARIVNRADDDLAAVAREDGGRVGLYWAAIPCDPRDAAVSLETDGSETSYYRHFDNLGDALKGISGTVTVFRATSLSKKVTLADDLTLRAAPGAVVEVSVLKDVGFTVTDGRKLAVSGISFAGGSGDGLFSVSGEGSELTLDEATVIDGYVGEGLVGAIGIWNGAKATVSAAIRNCQADGDDPFGGGAIYVDWYSELDLRGGEITCCWSATFGGGVYVAEDATVGISGPVTVTGNSSANSSEDDIYLENGALFELRTKDGFEPRTIGVQGEEPAKEGDTIIRAADGLGPLTAGDACCKAFFCDGNDNLVAIPSEDGESLVWKAKDDSGRLGETEDPSLAEVCVIASDGSQTNLYYTFAQGVAAAQDGETVALLMDVTANSTVEVSRSNVLCSATGASGLFIEDECELIINSGATLAITNLSIFSVASPKKKALLRANGGTLILADGARVGYGSGDGSRDANAVVVQCGGTLVLNEGAQVESWRNVYNGGDDPAVMAGVGGGVLSDGSTVWLNGGLIKGCSAFDYAGGLYAANGSEVHVAGDAVIDSNWDGGFRRSNVAVDGTSRLYLDGAFKGSIGISDGINLDTNVFGGVSIPVTTNLSADAANFFRDDNSGVRGVIATNEVGGAVLAWATAFPEQGVESSFEREEEGKDGEKKLVTYRSVGPVPEIGGGPQWVVVTNHPGSIAFKSIVRVSETEWRLVVTDRVEYCNYRLLWTTNLVEGFVSTGAWEHAVGAAAGKTWETNVITTGGAWFWRAEGKDGTNMVLRIEE